MIVLHLILLVLSAHSQFSLQSEVHSTLKPRLRKTRDLDFTIYYFEEESDESSACPKGYYKQKQKNLCRPICKKKCSNGKCKGPEKCSCNKGYELDPADIYTCLPICGIGKQRNLLDKQKCEPAMCSKECINSRCRGREDCHCMVGYQKDPSNDYACTPKCTEASCKNGSCTAEGECKCNEGYIKNTEEHCSPWCNRTCVNSTCTESNVCTCYPGYRSITEYKCECPEQSFIIDGICKPLNICNILCTDGRCSIAEKCFYCPELSARCFLIEMPEQREKCLNSTLCLANCTCSNEICICENTSTASTTATTPYGHTLYNGHTYPSSLPDVQTYGDFSDPMIDVQNNPSSIAIVSVGVVIVVVVLGAGIASGMVIRKRRKKSGGHFVQNDVYRTESSPQVNAIDIENEIYEETNEYEEIGEKEMKRQKS